MLFLPVPTRRLIEECGGRCGFARDRLLRDSYSGSTSASGSVILIRASWRQAKPHRTKYQQHFATSGCHPQPEVNHGQHFRMHLSLSICFATKGRLVFIQAPALSNKILWPTGSLFNGFSCCRCRRQLLTATATFFLH